MCWSAAQGGDLNSAASGAMVAMAAGDTSRRGQATTNGVAAAVETLVRSVRWSNRTSSPLKLHLLLGRAWTVQSQNKSQAHFQWHTTDLFPGPAGRRPGPALCRHPRRQPESRITSLMRCHGNSVGQGLARSRAGDRVARAGPMHSSFARSHDAAVTIPTGVPPASGRRGAALAAGKLDGSDSDSTVTVGLDPL